MFKPIESGILQPGLLTPVDLFDSRGVLLLAKGKKVNRKILCMANKLFMLENKMTHSNLNHNQKKLSSEMYQDILFNVRDLFETAGLINKKKITNISLLLDEFIKEIEQTPGICINFNEFKNYDNSTYVHSVNVSFLSTLIALGIGYKGSFLKNIAFGALLHDLGKQAIPLTILQKPSALTEQEFEIVRQHPIKGLEMISHLSLPQEILTVIRHHHERWNGTGYPDKLRQRGIETAAQIVAVADVFDSLLADRPYRKGLPPYHAVEIIMAGSNKDFAPSIVKAFIKNLVLYPKNSLVTLNTGETGIVLSVKEQYPTRPVVQILYDKWGSYVRERKMYDLLVDLTRFVISVELNQNKSSV